MKYPVITLKNGTEITASDIDENGQIKIYVEKWDMERDDFDSFEMILPNETIMNVQNFPRKEMQKIIKHISNLKSDILDYVKEKEGENVCQIL